MAKKPAAKRTNNARPHDGCIEKYDMKISRQRLESRGFVPSVSTRSPDEIVESWITMVQRRVKRHGVPKNASTQRIPMTRALLLLRQGKNYQPSLDTRTLEGIITFPDIGPLILQQIFADGYITVLNIALVSKRIWHAVFCGTNYWDFYAGKLRNIASAGIFVAATPQYSIHEMNVSRLIDPFGLGLTGPCEKWHTAAIAREEDILNKISMIRNLSGSNKPQESQAQTLTKETTQRDTTSSFVTRVFDPLTIHTVCSIQNVGEIWRASQFNANPPLSPFEPQMIYAASHLQALLLQIFEQRNAIKVLYFHKTPFLDRRALSIILRACPQLTMLGVYDCPLIHFGDLITVLDLIHEINRKRRKEKLAQFAGLDFYPHTKSADDNSQASIMTDPIELDVAQRGFFTILLKAFLKAKKLNLDVLFDERKALRSYLFQVPNPPLSVLSFLDAVERYTHIQPGSQKAKNEQKQTIYDILKPVRLGIESNLESDWPEWYTTVMDDHLVFCSSCGYEMPREFFPAGARRMRPHRRICAACTLQFLLDNEPHGMRQEKQRALSELLPTWRKEYFNKDAPLPLGCGNVINLRSSESRRPEVNPLQNVHGNLAARPYTEALVRDNKFHFDSVRGLPTLEELVVGPEQGEYWKKFFCKCNEEDVLARAKRRSRDEQNELQGVGAAELSVTGTPSAGPMTEVWRHHGDKREVGMYTFIAAAKIFQALVLKGW